MYILIAERWQARGGVDTYQLSFGLLSRPVPLPLPQQAAQLRVFRPPFWPPAAALAQQQPVPLELASQQLPWQLPQQLLSQLLLSLLQPFWQQLL